MVNGEKVTEEVIRKASEYYFSGMTVKRSLEKAIEELESEKQIEVY